MPSPTYIIDTDAGPDDVMALAYLLARDDVEIEAVTLSCGLAHGRQGAENLARVAALGGKGEIPIYIGQPHPLRGEAAFPPAWRRVADALPGVDLPSRFKPPQPEHAADFLKNRMRDTARPVRILALGPLTNLAALHDVRASLQTIEEIVFMGGAFAVRGNAFSAGDPASPTDAEWNLFIDPLAAQRVFNLGVPILVVPLDATNRVPIDAAFLDAFHAVAQTPLGGLVGHVLESIRDHVEKGTYYAWDPLAAVALMDRHVVQTVEHPVRIEQARPDAGTIRRAATGPMARVAYDADADRFRRLFLHAFAGP